MTTLEAFKQHLRPGEVYRRKDLSRWSTDVDQHVQQLLGDGTLTKRARGLYYVPRETVCGKVPPSNEERVTAFLETNDFLIISPNHYNRLGLGTTQLHNLTIVYN